MCDGHIVYQGNSRTSTDFFKISGYPSPLYKNPADHFMNILSVHYPKSREDEEKIDLLSTNYIKYLSKQIKDEQESVVIRSMFVDGSMVVDRTSSIQTTSSVDSQGKVRYKRKKVSLKIQFRQLLSRNVIEAQRDNRAVKAKIGQQVFIALISIAIFW